MLSSILLRVRVRVRVKSFVSTQKKCAALHEFRVQYIHCCSTLRVTVLCFSKRWRLLSSEEYQDGGPDFNQGSTPLAEIRHEKMMTSCDNPHVLDCRTTGW